MQKFASAVKKFVNEEDAPTMVDGHWNRKDGEGIDQQLDKQM